MTRLTFLRQSVRLLGSPRRRVRPGETPPRNSPAIRALLIASALAWLAIASGFAYLAARPTLWRWEIERDLRSRGLLDTPGETSNPTEPPRKDRTS